MDEGDEKRLWHVFRASRPVPRAEQVWRGDSALLGAPNVALLVGLAAVPVLGTLDSALWSKVGRTAGEPAPSFPSGIWVAWALVAGSLLQASLLDRFLARQTPRGAHGWMRFARLLVAAVPFFGFYAAPGWRWLLEHLPNQTFPTEQPGRRCDVLTRRALRPPWIRRLERASRWLAALRVIVPLYLFEMAVLLLLALWLAAEGSAGRRAAAWTFSIFFHLVAFLGMTVVFASQARRGMLSGAGTVGLCSLSLAWLPPVPMLPLLGAVPFLFVDVGRQERTLAHHLLAGRTGTTDRLRSLQGKIKKSWESTPWWRRIQGPPREVIPDAGNPDQVDAHLTDLYRLRSLSLPLETAWLTWMCLRHPRIFGNVHAALEPLSLLASALGLAGLSIVAVRFFRRLLHSTAAPASRDRHSMARAFAFTQLGFAAGLQIGGALHVRDPLGIAGMAGAAGLLGMLVIFGPLLLEILRPVPELFKRDIRQFVLWLLLCPLLLAANLRFSRTAPADLERDWRVFQALVEVAPLLGVFPGIAHLDWLLRPYAAKRMFSRELPPRVRATLAFLTLTGLLPLGGLAVPAWIAIRRRGWPIDTSNGNENKRGGRS